MTPILNLTQHAATAEQLADGVVEPTPEVRAEIVALLTCDDLPTPAQIDSRARCLAYSACAWLRANNPAQGIAANAAMIGGAPWLMESLATALRRANVRPVFAFSKRESVEQVQADGSVRKVASFRHVGWIDGWPGAAGWDR